MQDTAAEKTPPAWAGRHVRRSHAITLALPPERAFALFTPRGEELWVDGWAPLYVHPRDGALVRGLVFLTAAGSPGETVWCVLDHDAAAHRVRYARVTPGSRYGEVGVACSADGEGTRVEVTYELTALSDAGAAYVDDFTEPWFRGYIESWRRAIEHYLANGSKLPD